MTRECTVEDIQRFCIIAEFKQGIYFKMMLDAEESLSQPWSEICFVEETEKWTDANTKFQNHE
ncbi:Hypothetical predicted protein [Podarcis lilfordi]|uniref:Uncharacterized protein n=1 Tax=Podarcis lilfordi TaxID=74358 RepID=A0AA35KLQ7_9SAUR|nr:Hypothetical predicted protein [Podarcis lilfordi]